MKHTAGNKILMQCRFGVNFEKTVGSTTLKNLVIV